MTDLKDREHVCIAQSTHELGRSDVRLPRLGTSNFGDLLLESIDEALADLLGRKARESIYDYMTRERSISRSEIVAHLDQLSSLLGSIFGKGSKTIEKSIVRKLYSKLGWEFVEISSYELADYLKMLRDRVERDLANHIRHP